MTKMIPIPISHTATWVICTLAAAALAGGVLMLVFGDWSLGVVILGVILTFGGVEYLWLTVRARRAYLRYERRPR